MYVALPQQAEKLFLGFEYVPSGSRKAATLRLRQGLLSC